MTKKNKTIIVVAVILLLLILLSVILLIDNDEEEITLTSNNNVVTTLMGSSQSEIEGAIKLDLEENEYALGEAKVYLNPYGTSPLSALIVFKTSTKQSITVTVKGKNDNDLVTTYDSSIYHYIPVYGLYANYDNTVIIESSGGSKVEFTITTEVDDLPDTTANTTSSSDTDYFYFITSPISMSSYAVDTYGEVRWISNDVLYHDIVNLDNGHILIGTDTFNSDGLSTRIYEIDYLGKVYEDYYIDEGYLNDIYLLDNGNILLESKSSERDTYSDYIIEINRETGKIEKTFDIYKLLEEIDSTFTDGLDAEYFYASGLNYDADTDSLTVTYWGGEFVINIDYTDGNINWIFGNPDNFTSAFSSVLLTLESGDYPMSMHSAVYKNGKLYVLDNGFSVNTGEYKISSLKGSYSSANTYKIENGTISLESNFNLNKSLFSYALGDYDVLSSSELMLFGRELNDVNYNSSDYIYDYMDLSSRLIEVKDDETVLDIEISGASYSVTKIDVTQDINYSFDLVSSHTTLNSSSYEEITDDILTLIKETEATVDYEIGYSNGEITTNVSFMSSEEAKIILIDENNNGGIYTLKIKGNTESEKVITDLSSGTYYIYIYENEIMYKIDAYIVIE